MKIVSRDRNYVYTSIDQRDIEFSLLSSDYQEGYVLVFAKGEKPRLGKELLSAPNIEAAKHAIAGITGTTDAAGQPLEHDMARQANPENQTAQALINELEGIGGVGQQEPKINTEEPTTRAEELLALLSGTPQLSSTVDQAHHKTPSEAETYRSEGVAPPSKENSAAPSGIEKAMKIVADNLLQTTSKHEQAQRRVSALEEALEAKELENAHLTEKLLTVRDDRAGKAGLLQELRAQKIAAETSLAQISEEHASATAAASALKVELEEAKSEKYTLQKQLEQMQVGYTAREEELDRRAAALEEKEAKTAEALAIKEKELDRKIKEASDLSATLLEAFEEQGTVGLGQADVEYMEELRNLTKSALEANEEYRHLLEAEKRANPSPAFADYVAEMKRSLDSKLDDLKEQINTAGKQIIKEEAKATKKIVDTQYGVVVLRHEYETAPELTLLQKISLAVTSAGSIAFRLLILLLASFAASVVLTSLISQVSIPEAFEQIYNTTIGRII